MVARLMTREIDVRHLGREHVICAYEMDGLVVDPGPASSVDALLDALGGEGPRALLLTHIHLDHAGAAGVLTRAFPSMTVYVHERGAPHLIDPSGLLKSAKRLYGDDMDRLWGEVAPVPAERVHALAGGETVEGMRVAYTPGHASHHVCYFNEDTGEAFVGDVGGVRMPGGTYTVIPTPPPDIDVEAWLRSLDEVAAMKPTTLCLTHFGRYDDVSEQLERVRTGLRVNAEQARTTEASEFAAWSEAQTRAAVEDEDTVQALLQAAPPDHLGMGLRRYWEKKGP
jgi:glyoxylase-like metal-dependent hydrolase (beta-lactamase superfamily II)